jgi:tight adherence protein B
MNWIGFEMHYLLGLLAMFGAVASLAYAVTRLVVEPLVQKRRLLQRIKGNKRESEVQAQIFKAYQESQESVLLNLVQRVVGWGKVENLQRQLLQADIYVNPGAFLSYVGILACIGFILGATFFNLTGGTIAALPLGMLPVMFMRWKKRRKAARIEKAMPEAMELLARSLRAGHTLASTIEMVSQEVPAPLGTEFRITYEEQRLGLSLPQALRRMGERVASQDLRFFVTAVMIQNETGGNLAEILENIGGIIRERMILKGKVQGLTAEGRFSALILVGLPVFTFVMLLFLNPAYVMLLMTDPLGKKMLMGGIISIVLGALVMKKMVAIKV